MSSLSFAVFLWLLVILSLTITMIIYIVSTLVTIHRMSKKKLKVKNENDDVSNSVIAKNMSPIYSKRDPMYSSIYEAEGMRVIDIGVRVDSDADIDIEIDNGVVGYAESRLEDYSVPTLEMFDQGPQKKNDNKVLHFAPDELTSGSVAKQKGQHNRKQELSLSNITIYLINMAKSHDRYKRFKENIKKSDLSSVGFNRIEGVNGKSQNIKRLVSPEAYKRILESEKTNYRHYHYELTRGAVGCYLSHINVYKEVLRQRNKYAIIFEDDVRILKPNLLEEINKILPTIPKDWDILLLGCVCFVCGKFSSYYDVNRYFLMHGYIIKKSSAEKILHMIENEPIEQQIDAKFSDLAERGLLKIYCLRNKLAVQWDMGTNIQIPVKNIKGINPFDALVEPNETKNAKDDNDNSENSGRDDGDGRGGGDVINIDETSKIITMNPA